MASTNFEELFGPPISVYTHQQALDDGVIIDLDMHISGEQHPLHKQAGWVHMPCCTVQVWSEVVNWPDDRFGQSNTGRLWDLLSMAMFAWRRELHTAVKTGRDPVWPVPFQMLVTPRGSQTGQPLTVNLVVSLIEETHPPKPLFMFSGE